MTAKARNTETQITSLMINEGRLLKRAQQMQELHQHVKNDFFNMLNSLCYLSQSYHNEKRI